MGYDEEMNRVAAECDQADETFWAGHKTGKDWLLGYFCGMGLLPSETHKTFSKDSSVHKATGQTFFDLGFKAAQIDRERIKSKNRT